jgi:myo-inositol-1(or 4)-monophosphatase
VTRGAGRGRARSGGGSGGSARRQGGGRGGSGGRVIPWSPGRKHGGGEGGAGDGGDDVLRDHGPAGPGGGGPVDFHVASCIAAAKAAGRVLLDHYGKRGALPMKMKGRNDYVTAADRQAEETVLRLLHARFPDHAIVAEESASESSGSGRARGSASDAGTTVGYRWYVDPLDGTTNFIHKVPMFCVSIGLSDPEGMRAAAVYDPLRDEMFTAARGQGAHLNGEPVAVAQPGKLERALLVTGIPFRSLDRLESYLASFRAFIHEAGGIRRDGSAALDLAYVACGRYDGFWEMGLSPWDVAAGSLLVTEAGGVVTDFTGRGGYIESGDIIAAPPEIHPDMLRVVRAAYRK